MIQDTALELFRKRFHSDPDVLALAPGRVNLIGEHTDYNDGYVFPAAIDRGIAVALRRTSGPTQVESSSFGASVPFDVRSIPSRKELGWVQYPAGVAWALGGDLPNLEGYLVGDLLHGSGVSSSAALELVFAVAWNALAGLGHSNLELAKICQRAENRFVGVQCGIMDQMASAMGKAGHAMFLDTRSLEIRYAPIPAGILMVLCDTQTPRELTAGIYNERVNKCAEAAKALQVPKLRDATLEQLETVRTTLDPEAFRRARHVISENRRCLDFADALQVGDLGQVGKLMHEGHASLRDDYEVSSVALDHMAAAAESCEGCIGARMTGAGLGGACIVLVNAAQIEQFLAGVAVEYRRRSGLEGVFTVCEASDGARLLQV